MDNHDRNMSAVYTILTWVISTMVLGTLIYFFITHVLLFHVFAFLVFICVLLLIAAFTWRHITKYTYHDIGPSGTHIKPTFGKGFTVAPIGLDPSKILGTATTKVTEAAQVFPRLGELAQQGKLIQQHASGTHMFQGFRKDETMRYGSWPGVIAVTGMQNVGKTITLVMLILIALLQGSKVVVCDTHRTKARSLYRKIIALREYVTFATTEEEVLAETSHFSEELNSRKQGSNPYPIVIFYDEFNSLIRARNEELRKLLPTTIEEASQEGAGYNLHMVVAIHDLSNNGIGDARFRSFFNWIYCHRMEAGQSKFIEAFNVRKIKQFIAALPPGHAVVRDEVNEIEYLVVPYGDSTDVLAARQQIEQKRNVSEVETTRFVERSQAETKRFDTSKETLRLDAPPEINRFDTYQDRKQEVIRLRGLRFNQSEIIYRIWGARPGESQLYRDALAEYKQILREL